MHVHVDDDVDVDVNVDVDVSLYVDDDIGVYVCAHVHVLVHVHVEHVQVHAYAVWGSAFERAARPLGTSANFRPLVGLRFRMLGAPRCYGSPDFRPVVGWAAVLEDRFQLQDVESRLLAMVVMKT